MHGEPPGIVWCMPAGKRSVRALRRNVLPMTSRPSCGHPSRVDAPAVRAARSRCHPFLIPSFVPSPTRFLLAAWAVLAGAGTCQAQAQAPAATGSALDPVVVTATRSETRASEAIAEVTVIDRAALERSDGQPLVEVLAREPGVQFSGSGGLGKTGALFIRGHESRHTLLLIDGVRIGSATSGLPSLDNLPLDAFERVELVRGPLSSLYGSDAVGGVVQMFTRRGGTGLRPNARVTFGSDGYRQVGGGLAFGDGRFDGAIQVQSLATDGFSATNPREPFASFDPDRDGFRQNAASVRLGAQLTERWRLDGLLLEARGLSHYDDGPGADARAKLRTALQSLQANGRIGEHWRTRLIAAHSVDRYDTIATASPFFDLGSIETSQWQFTWENTFVTPLGTALALLERLDQDVSRPGQPFTVGDRTIDAIALGLTGEAGGHGWQASVRNDRNSQFGDQTTGSLGWSYAFAPAWSAAASYGTSFVAPNFNQLYYPGFGNPNLRPEEGRHAELSLQWRSGPHAVRAAWFDSRIRSFISPGPAPVNVPRTRIDGLALSYAARWHDLQLGASIDRIDPRNETTGANFGKRLPRRSKLAAKAHVDWIRDAWTIGATWSAYSDRFDDTANSVALPGYGIVDLRADWRFARDWSLGARLNNVADKVYETALGYNQAGREFFVTLRYAPR